MTSKVQRPRVAIVCPDLDLLGHFDAISNHLGGADLAVFSFNSKKTVNAPGMSLPLYLFEPLPDMPGYMRGLEDRLATFDVIIGMDTWQLSAFQAMRAAVKFSRPFGCIVTCQKSFAFVDFPNIRAIQSDILARTDRFFPTSQVAKQVLLSEGVAENRMTVVYPALDPGRWANDPALRVKFRKYLGIPQASLVALYQGPMEKHCRPQNLVEAVSILRRAGLVELPRLKLLFVGDGEYGKELRYLASDARIGGLCLFLAQDATPFQRDLYCASDIMIAPHPLEDVRTAWSGLNILRGMAVGVVPVTQRGTSEAEWSGATGLPLEGDSPSSLAASLARILKGPESLLASWQSQVRARASLDFNSRDRGLEWQREVDVLLTLGQQRSEAAPSVLGRIKSFDAMIDAGRHQDALVEIEGLLLGNVPGDESKAQLLCMKGEVLSQLGDLDGSVAAFQSAISTGQSISRCYRGLGYVSIKSHSHEEAITFFKKSIGIDSEDHQSMLGIGLVYRRLKLYEDALYWAEKCLNLAPQTMSAILLAAQTASETNNVKEGIETLERLREVTAENRNIVVALAQLYMKVGKSELASELLASTQVPNATAGAKTAA